MMFLFCNHRPRKGGKNPHHYDGAKGHGVPGEGRKGDGGKTGDGGNGGNGEAKPPKLEC